MEMLNRRQLLSKAGIIALGGSALALPAIGQQKSDRGGMSLFNVHDFGAFGDGARLTSAAINRAIDACHARGGGTVYVPPGIYLCGTVELKSNVTLYLEAGATLLGSKKLTDYTPHPYRSANGGAGGGPAFNRDARDTSPYHLIFARDAENVALIGPGRLDGQGPAYWVPSGKKPLPPEEAWQEVATHAWKAISRPSPMLEFYNCKHLRIEGVQIMNSAGWTLRPADCDNVFIHGITIKNPYGINTDGIDLIGCKNVFISDCLIDTGDDAICLKSQSSYGDDVRVSKNITITNCVLTCCCNGLKFGTASFGRFENITFSNSVIFNEDVELKSRVISGVALEIVDGGSMEGVLISNIRMQRVRTPIFVKIGNRHPQADGSPGTIRGIRIENVHATDSILTSSITGQPGCCVEDVTLSGIRIDSEEDGKEEWVGLEIHELPKAYPEARMFGRLPCYGMYCRHVKGLRLRQMEFKAAASEERPAVFCDDVNDVEICGLRGTPIVGNQPVIKLVQTQQAFIHGCTSPAGTKTFVEVYGDRSDGVVLMNNNLNGAQKPAAWGAEVADGAVIVSGGLK
ncbi:MAG: Polygalacturonase [Pedosphaera sp.]|nr:Polygalacturonase [Pedosphaera sp.]